MTQREAEIIVAEMDNIVLGITSTLGLRDDKAMDIESKWAEIRDYCGGIISNSWDKCERQINIQQKYSVLSIKKLKTE